MYSKRPPGFADADSVLTTHQNPAFDQIVQKGYKIVFQLEERSPEVRHLEVVVLLGEEVVGHFDFADQFGRAFPQNADTVLAHRRNGIATAAYVFAEVVFALPLEDDWKDKKSESAKAFWQQPNRPFGKLAPGPAQN